MNRRTLLGSLAALVACAAFGLLPAAAHADAAPAPAAKAAKKAPAKQATAKKAPAKKATAKKAPAKKAPHAYAYTGEVLDLDCYLAHGAHGAGHAACALGCLKDGAPAGLLIGHHAYLLIGDKAHIDAYKSVRGMAAKKVTVMGHKMWRHGFHAIVVEGVKGS